MKIDTITSKGDGLLNEDVLLTGKNIFGVFDGATSLNKYVDKNGNTGGLIAAQIARDVFSDGKGSLLQTAKRANREIEKAMKEVNIDTNNAVNLWRSAAAVVKITENILEWLVIADCVVLLIKEDNTFETVVPFRSHDNAVMEKWKKLAEKKELHIREKLHKDIEDLRKESRPAYGVLNGQQEMEKLFVSGEFSLTRVKHILLLTDGFLMPSEDPIRPEDFSQIVSLFLKGGLEKVMKTIRGLESADPNCWKYPRYKQHDDIAAISISFNLIG